MKKSNVLTTLRSLVSRNLKRYCLLVLLISTITLYCLIPQRHNAYDLRDRPCRIHSLDPWDETLKEYLRDPKPVKCSNYPSLFYVDHLGILKMNQSAKASYQLTSLECAYHKISRKTNDMDIEIEKPVKFDGSVFVQSRVFRVVCTSGTKAVYDFVHVNVVWNESNYRELEIGKETLDDLSIIYFGLDSASRSHALRKLPKSYKYLKETLGAYDFRGFMKVGLNSFPNVVPMLTGHEHTKFHMENILRVHLDSMPFIWKEPRMQRYATFHSEDRPDISTMNYLNSGFKKKPVDYYYREYALAMDQLSPTVVNPLGKSTWYCYGNKQHFLLQIDYLKSFIAKYTNRLKFAFLWNNQIGHEDFISLGRGDQPLLKFLQWMKGNGHLEKSILIVGSDHGFRLGGASTTYVGRLENNMPFLMVYVPDELKKRYPWIPKNLQHNTDMLVSAYDIHETMMAVINKKFENAITAQVSETRTSRSLFQRIPDSRSCADAGIPSQYCTCYDATSVNTDDSVVTYAANFVVTHLNNLLHKYNVLCRPLYLLNITEAKVMYTAEGDDDNRHIDRNPGLFKRLLGRTADFSGRYNIMLYTGPNNGLIEAMIDYEERPVKGPRNKLTVIGDPVRVNKYGNQSHCIQDAVLRQYCICNDVHV